MELQVRSFKQKQIWVLYLPYGWDEFSCCNKKNREEFLWSVQKIEDWREEIWERRRILLLVGKEIASKMGLGCGFHLFFEEEAPKPTLRYKTWRTLFFQICCLGKVNWERERDNLRSKHERRLRERRVLGSDSNAEERESRSQEEYGFRKNKVTMSKDMWWRRRDGEMVRLRLGFCIERRRNGKM